MEERSFLQRLKRGLLKSRENWGQRLSGVFYSRQWDETSLETVEEILLAGDIGVKATQKLLAAVRKRTPSGAAPSGQEVFSHLQSELIQLLQQTAATALPPFSARPWVVLVLGVNGVGKTTTIGKLAAQCLATGKKPLLVAADTFRAAAVEQLDEWGKRVGADVIKHRAGADPSAVVYDGMQAANSRGVDVLLIDTAGRLHTKIHLIEELKKIRRVISRERPDAPHETLLVLDATTGQNGLQQARVFREATTVNGIVLTKLDGTAKGGVIVSIQEELGVPVRYIGVGEEVDDLQAFDPVSFVQALLQR